MSIHKDHKSWLVKWRIAGGQRSRSFARRADAVAFDAEIKYRRAEAKRFLDVKALEMPGELIAWVDRKRAEVGLTRAEWIRAALEGQREREGSVR